MKKMIKVLVVDDHSLLRQGLVSLLEMSEDIKVIGQATDGLEAIEMAEKLRPDVILMDVNMPNLNGIEATKEIVKRLPGSNVLCLSIHDDEEYIAEMIRVGAKGYILKDSEPSSVVQAVYRLVAGETFFPSNLMRKVMTRFHQLVNKNPTPSVKAEEISHLTPRELEVLQCIVDGLSNKEISSILFISEKTVKNHITNLFRKINVSDRTQAAVYAVQNGLVTPKPHQSQ